MTRIARLISDEVSARIPHAMERIYGFLRDARITWDECWVPDDTLRWHTRRQASQGRHIVYAVLWDMGLGVTEIGRIAGVDHQTVKDGIRSWAGCPKGKRGA